MKCIANTACQAYISESKIKTFDRGDTWDFKKCPPNFTPLEKIKEDILDLENLTEEQILEAEISKEILVDYAKDNYAVDLKKFKKPSTLARAFVDARFRYTDKQQLKDLR